MEASHRAGKSVRMPSSRLLFGRRSIRFAYYTLTTTVAKRRRIFTDEASVKCVVDALRQSDLVIVPEDYPHHWNRWLHEAAASTNKNGTPKDAVSD